MSRTAGIFAVSAWALGASAFLIPPGVALASNGGAITDAALIGTKNFALKVPCSECVFSPKKEEIKDEAENDLFWIQGGANAVVLNFTVSEDGKRLALNGEDIYPFPGHSRSRTFVNQVPTTSTWEDIKAGSARTTPLELTGSVFTIESSKEFSPQGDTLVAIKHTILELEQQPVSVDSVAIKLLKTDVDDELSILHAETVARLPPRPNDAFGHPPEELERLMPTIDEIMNQLEPKQCSILPPALCKLKNTVEAKVQGMKAGIRKGGCRGGKSKGHLPGHIRPHFMSPHHDGEAPPPRHHGRPHHMRPHGHHHGVHERGFMSSFINGFTAVLIPTLAGIAVGMSVSVLGLLVGRLISFLWIKLYRGGRRGYASVALDDTILDSEMEKGDYEMEKEAIPENSVEAPPAYEQAPAYVEFENEER